MRIISGKYGGRRFDTPRNLSARPTTDMAKESLFNIIVNRMNPESIAALDLFAGTGAISFELVSRGAAKVVSIEKEHAQQTYIQKIHDTLHLGREHILLRGDVFRFIKSCRERFDFIFADPPYDLPELTALPQLILDSDLLNANGLLVVEHGKHNDFSTHPCFLEMRKYGAVHFSFFSKQNEVGD